jgi:hypothetical protein
MGAKLHTSGVSFWMTIAHAAPAGIVGTFLLITGYALGLKTYQNIWIVSAVSIGSLLIIEPIFNFLYIGDWPTLGAGIGFALGVLGILAAFLL